MLQSSLSSFITTVNIHQRSVVAQEQGLNRPRVEKSASLKILESGHLGIEGPGWRATCFFTRANAFHSGELVSDSRCHQPGAQRAGRLRSDCRLHGRRGHRCLHASPICRLACGSRTERTYRPEVARTDRSELKDSGLAFGSTGSQSAEALEPEPPTSPDWRSGRPGRSKRESA